MTYILKYYVHIGVKPNIYTSLIILNIININKIISEDV